jgi:hypothetical protein
VPLPSAPHRHASFIQQQTSLVSNVVTSDITGWETDCKQFEAQVENVIRDKIMVRATEKAVRRNST